jgi:hypothetical protein
VDPVARTVSDWFDIAVEGTLASASVDPDNGRLALGISGPFALLEYDLPGGAGPHPMASGSGPIAQLYRFEPYNTAVRHDGHLLVQRGLLSVDPNTGIRSGVPPPILDGNSSGPLYPDPLTGESIADTQNGIYLHASDFSSSRRLGDSVGRMAAYDFVSRKLYGVGDNVVNVLDVATGALQTIPSASDDLRKVASCFLAHTSVSNGQGALYLESATSGPIVPPASLCGCFKFEFATGNVTPFACIPDQTRDGRLLVSTENAVNVVDPDTGTPTPFSRAPDHGRGFPIPVAIRSSLAIDPRRDRIWVSVVYNDFGPLPQRYFVIDPFNGDRALVSD